MSSKVKTHDMQPLHFLSGGVAAVMTSNASRAIVATARILAVLALLLTDDEFGQRSGIEEAVGRKYFYCWWDAGEDAIRLEHYLDPAPIPPGGQIRLEQSYELLRDFRKLLQP